MGIQCVGSSGWGVRELLELGARGSELKGWGLGVQEQMQKTGIVECGYC